MLKITVSEAQGVFDDHLFSAVWDNATSAVKAKAVAHASRDISSLNYSSAAPRNLVVSAVAEQILLLLSMTATDRERVKAMATGVKQRGTRDAYEWYYDEKPSKLISPDAIAILESYVHRRTGGIR